MARSESYFDARAIGIEMFHKHGNTINRPQGSGDFVFIHFLTPAEVIVGETVHPVKPDACILYAPPAHQYYRNVPNASFGNNWMHFTGPGCLAFLKSLDIPLNRPFRPGETGFIATELRYINDEKIRQEPYWRVGLDLSIRRLFLKLARTLQPITRRRTTMKYMETFEQMQRLRSRIRESCYEAWTVEGMAAAMHLSKSRFSVLYRKMFRASPLADLLKMRMDLAKYYLGMMQMSVEEVAESCGFASVYYFHRQFKKFHGVTPGVFQKTYSGESLHSPFHRSLEQWYGANDRAGGKKRGRERPPAAP